MKIRCGELLPLAELDRRPQEFPPQRRRTFRGSDKGLL